MNITLVSVIEGATSGIGAETARVLAKRGLRLVIPARDLKRAAEVKDWIQGESPEAEIILMEMDLSSFASINRFCSMFLSLGLPLNILVWVRSRQCCMLTILWAFRFKSWHWSLQKQCREILQEVAAHRRQIWDDLRHQLLGQVLFLLIHACMPELLCCYVDDAGRTCMHVV